jgi:hypothetical protein
MAKKKKRAEELDETSKKKGKKVKLPRAVKIGLFLLLATSPFLLAAGLLAFFVAKGAADRIRNNREENLIREAIAQKDRLIQQLRQERDALRAERNEATTVAASIPEEINVNRQEELSQMSDLDISEDTGIDLDDDAMSVVSDITTDTDIQPENDQEADVSLDQNESASTGQFEDAEQEDETESSIQSEDVAEDTTLVNDQFADVEEETLQAQEGNEDLEEEASYITSEELSNTNEQEAVISEDESLESDQEETISEDESLESDQVEAISEDESLESDQVEDISEDESLLIDQEEAISEAESLNTSNLDVRDEESIDTTLYGSAIMDQDDTDSLAYSGSEVDIDGLSFSDDNLTETEQLNNGAIVEGTPEGMTIAFEEGSNDLNFDQRYEADDELSADESLKSDMDMEDFPSEEIDGIPVEEASIDQKEAKNNELTNESDNMKGLGKSNSLNSLTSATASETLAASSANTENSQMVVAFQGATLNAGAFMAVQPTERARDYVERNGAELSAKRNMSVKPDIERANKRPRIS